MFDGKKTYITAFFVAATALAFYFGSITQDQALAAFMFEVGAGLAAIRDKLGKK